jgi:hypothetical protein
MKLPVLIALGVNIAGVNPDSAYLMSQAACLECQIPPGFELPVLIALACDILNTTAAPCVTPTTPVITGGNVLTNFISVTWTETSDPKQDFLFYWGTSSTGPFPNTKVFAANLRSATFDGGQFFSSDVYGYLVARNSVTCVSANSNIFDFPIAG